MLFVTIQMKAQHVDHHFEKLNTNYADVRLMNSPSVFPLSPCERLQSVCGHWTSLQKGALAGAFKQWLPRSREAWPWN